MMRFLHVVAISGLIGSAAYAYTVKYETLFYAEELVKLKAKLARERDGIQVAKAEWALLTRPDRLQRMAEKHLDLQPININQLAQLSDLPKRPDRGDEIGRKLELLGLEPATTSSLPKKPADAKGADKAPDRPVAAAKPGASARPVVAASSPPSAPKAAEPKAPSMGDVIAKALGLGGPDAAPASAGASGRTASSVPAPGKPPAAKPPTARPPTTKPSSASTASGQSAAGSASTSR